MQAVIAHDGLYAKDGLQVAFLTAGTPCEILNESPRRTKTWIFVSVEGEGIFPLSPDEVIVTGDRVRS